MTYTLPDKTEKTVGIRMIYEIIERTIDKHGQYFLVPDIFVTAPLLTVQKCDDIV